MDRRSFFGAAATLLAVPLAPRRVYSFLWDNPLLQRVVPGVYMLGPDGSEIRFIKTQDGMYVSTEPVYHGAYIIHMDLRSVGQVVPYEGDSWKELLQHAREHG